MIPKTTILLGLALLLLGCDENSMETTESNDPSLYEITFQTLDQFDQEMIEFSQGEDITFVLQIKNISNNKLTIRFNNGCQYRFKILDENNEEPYSRWNPQLCTEALTNFTLEPNNIKEHRETWNQVTFSSLSPLQESLLPVGVYTVEAVDYGVDSIITRNLHIK